MTALAATAAGHIGRHLGGRAEVRVALSGGVWASPAARAALTTGPWSGSARAR